MQQFSIFRLLIFVLLRFGPQFEDCVTKSSQLRVYRIRIYLNVHFLINLHVLQLFDSVLKLSILVNLQSHVLCKNIRFAQYFRFSKKCPKTHNTYYASRAKDTQKFAKKYLRENFANFDQQISAFQPFYFFQNI